jgi:hypothetical protein
MHASAGAANLEVALPDAAADRRNSPAASGFVPGPALVLPETMTPERWHVAALQGLDGLSRQHAGAPNLLL